MRKLVSIALLTIFVFNLIGYKFLFDFLQTLNDRNFEAVIDHNLYDEKDLVTVRIPLSMPYQPSNTEFERVSGEIHFGNTIYKYVKRKIDQGDLVLLCLPDKKKTELEYGRDEFYKLANEYQQLNATRHPAGKTVTIFKLSVFILSDAGTPLVQRTAIPAFLPVIKSPALPRPFIFSPGKPPNSRSVLS